ARKYITPSHFIKMLFEILSFYSCLFSWQSNRIPNCKMLLLPRTAYCHQYKNQEYDDLEQLQDRCLLAFRRDKKRRPVLLCHKKKNPQLLLPTVFLPNFHWRLLPGKATS